MAVGLVNLGDIEYEKRFEGGVRFATDWGDISRRLGGRKLGAGHWIVPPGRASVPYHAHLVNEELVFVLGGEIHVRLNGEVYALDLLRRPPELPCAEDPGVRPRRHLEERPERAEILVR